jgi:2-polyprenyl-3-methyl-5-hydroxy-6-metoxy-1,4-benzoquinol methylase
LKEHHFHIQNITNKKKIKGKILDFGLRHWKRCRALKLKGFNIVGYDPFYFQNIQLKKFDTIICFYVLNVLPEEQAEVLMNVSNLLKPNGKIFCCTQRYSI